MKCGKHQRWNQGCYIFIRRALQCKPFGRWNWQRFGASQNKDWQIKMRMGSVGEKKKIRRFSFFLPASSPCLSLLPLFCNRELRQQWRRRLRKRHLNTKVALLQTLSHLFHLWLVKCWQFFLDLISPKHFSKFRKRKRKSFSCVHILYKTWN